MYKDFSQSAKSLIADLFKDLALATEDRKHPFRFCYLSTTQVDHVPTLRTIVLRKVLTSNEMLIFADYRTPKIQEVKQQPQVALLFYHPIQQLQIRFQAIASIHHQNTLSLQEWSKLTDYAKNDYQTILPPGSDLPTKDQENIHDANLGSNFFSILSLKPINIDVLQLSNGRHHQRMVGEFKNGDWFGRKVIP